MNRYQLNSLVLMLLVSLLGSSAWLYAQEETTSSSTQPQTEEQSSQQPSTSSSSEQTATEEAETSDSSSEAQTTDESEASSSNEEEVTAEAETSDGSSEAQTTDESEASSSNEEEVTAEAETSDSSSEAQTTDESEASSSNEEEVAAEAETSDSSSEAQTADESEASSSDEEEVAAEAETSDGSSEAQTTDESEASSSDEEEVAAEAETSDGSSEAQTTDESEASSSDEEEVAEENTESGDESSASSEPQWATRWIGSFNPISQTKDDVSDSICDLYTQNKIDNWAAPQWITVTGWVRLASDAEDYDGGPLKAKLSAGWYVAHPSDALCPVDEPCVGSENMQIDPNGSRVVVGNEDGLARFTVTGWWPGVSESYANMRYLIDTEGNIDWASMQKYPVENHYGINLYDEAGQPLPRSDKKGKNEGLGKDLFWYPYQVTKSCPFMLPPPPSCLIYALHDEDLNDSYFFTIDPSQDFAVEQLGSSYKQYDLEGLAIDPQGDRLLASSGNDSAQGLPQGYLYEVNKANGNVTGIGSICFTDLSNRSVCGAEVSALGFHPDGSLWAWAENYGLLTIDPETAEGTLVIYGPTQVEDLSWNTKGDMVYLIAQDTLWSYDGENLKQNCQVGSQVEAIERLPDSVRAAYGLEQDNDVLLFAYHKSDDLTIHAMDAKNCEILDSLKIETESYYDIEGISWVCQGGVNSEPEMPAADSSTSTPEGSFSSTYAATDVANVITNKWDSNYNSISSSWVGGDAEGALGIRFENLSVPANYYIESAKLIITNNRRTEWTQVSVKVQAERNSAPDSFSPDALPSERDLTRSNHRYSENAKWDEGDTLTIEATGPLRELMNENLLGDSLVLVLTGEGSSYGRKFFFANDVELVLKLAEVPTYTPEDIEDYIPPSYETSEIETESEASSETEPSDNNSQETSDEVEETDTEESSTQSESSEETEQSEPESSEETEQSEPESSEETEQSEPESSEETEQSEPESSEETGQSEPESSEETEATNDDEASASATESNTDTQTTEEETSNSEVTEEETVTSESSSEYEPEAEYYGEGEEKEDDTPVYGNEGVEEINRPEGY